jgi:hypothetical protein
MAVVDLHEQLSIVPCKSNPARFLPPLNVWPKHVARLVQP